MTKEEFKTNYAGGHIGDSNDVRKRLLALAEFAWAAVKWRGAKTAAQVAAVSGTENGDMYQIVTTGGDLNAGGDAITTAAGDLVIYNGETDLWEFVLDKA